MTKMEKNRMIQTNIIKLENKITWISPKISLGRKMTHNKAHSLHTSEDGFIIRPSYMDIHISYVLHIVIGKLRTWSHQLEIEIGRYARIPLEERICHLCPQEPGHNKGVTIDQAIAILFWFLFSNTRQHFRCNLLFGLICHFSLLKDFNISFLKDVKRCSREKRSLYLPMDTRFKCHYMQYHRFHYRR